MSKKYRGLTRKTDVDGRPVWHIDKVIKGHGRLCESCGTDDEDEAGDYLTQRVKEIRDSLRHGIRPKRTFRQAATRYLNERSHLRGTWRDSDALLELDHEFPLPGGSDAKVNIMDMFIDEIHDGSFDPYRHARRNPTKPSGNRKTIRPTSNATLNRNIGVAARVLEDAATKWRDGKSNLTWLAQMPWINYAMPHQKRQPYPLDWDEQRLLFEELPPHLLTMSEFDVNCGARDEAICALEWAWEQRVPELDTTDLERTVFIVPPLKVKGRTLTVTAKLLVLNDAAQRIVDSQRGLHPRYVFTFERNGKRNRGRRNRICTLRTPAWLKARDRAVERYEKELGRPCPKGFRRLRVQDFRHTFGRRLRAAKVSFEDRQDLLWHTSGRVTTDYSAPEIGALVEAANLVTKSRESPARTVLRIVGGGA